MDTIVFDLEWNQGDPAKGEVNEDLTFEVIELGAVRLDQTGRITDTFHRIIQPVVYPHLYARTRQIILLTEEDLADGITFQEAITDFLAWCSLCGEYRFATWGTLDLYELQRNMAYHRIPNRFPHPMTYLNVQQLYSIQFDETEQAHSLESIVESMHIRASFAYHGALNDALYTAKIFARLDPSYADQYPAVDLYNYPRNKEEEVTVRYPDYSIFISRGYDLDDETHREAPHLQQLRCPVCGKKAHRVIPWYSSNAKVYYAIGTCRDHGSLRAKRSVHIPSEGTGFDVITTRLISQTQAAGTVRHYREKQKRQQMKADRLTENTTAGTQNE